MGVCKPRLRRPREVHKNFCARHSCSSLPTAFLFFYGLQCQPFTTVTMARAFRGSRVLACLVSPSHGSASAASTCSSSNLREGHGPVEGRPIIVCWMGARLIEPWREDKKMFPVPAAALFEEEVLIKAALNCNQELIVKLLGVIRASQQRSATYNNTLSPSFIFQI